jgi:hypothetical protein
VNTVPKKPKKQEGYRYFDNTPDTKARDYKLTSVRRTSSLFDACEFRSKSCFSSDLSHDGGQEWAVLAPIGGQDSKVRDRKIFWMLAI